MSTVLDRCTARVFTTAAEMAAFADVPVPPSCGAQVIFAGVVRNEDGGAAVDELEYLGHPSAEAVLCRLVDEFSRDRPELARIRVAHRVGLLRVGDCALYAEVCTPHRAAAFAAVAALVDEVKRELPIWKRQLFADGREEWVNCP